MFTRFKNNVHYVIYLKDLGSDIVAPGLYTPVDAVVITEIKLTTTTGTQINLDDVIEITIVACLPGSETTGTG